MKGSKRREIMPKIINKNDIVDFIGYQAEPTAWHQIDQKQINLYAD